MILRPEDRARSLPDYALALFFFIGSPDAPPSGGGVNTAMDLARGSYHCWANRLLFKPCSQTGFGHHGLLGSARGEELGIQLVTCGSAEKGF